MTKKRFEELKNTYIKLNQEFIDFVKQFSVSVEVNESFDAVNKAMTLANSEKMAKMREELDKVYNDLYEASKRLVK